MITFLNIKNFFSKSIKISTREITFGAIFSAASAAIIIILIVYTPIGALPTIRIAFEGILVKLSGYLFGVVVGFLCGNITEILILLLRPTFVHFGYYLGIVLYGVFGGIIKNIYGDKKNLNRNLTILVILSTIIFLSFSTYFIIARNGFAISLGTSSFIDRYLSFDLKTSLIFLYTLQAFIFLIPFAFYFSLIYWFPKHFNLYRKIMPIYYLSILTGYFVSVPLISLGDSVSYGVSYETAILFSIFFIPYNIIANMIIIYLVWKIIHKVIDKYKPIKKLTRKEILEKNNFFIEQIINSSKKNKIFKINHNNNYKKIYNYEKITKSKVLNENIKIISLTGTNGKSSVSNYISKYIQEKNKNVGLFISPHMDLITERISVNGKNISFKDFSRIYWKIYPYSKILKFHFFDYLFFISLEYFKEENVKYLVLECGIGAKNDIVGMLKNNISIITNISKDHYDYFDGSIEKTAQDKIHILKDKSTCIINEKNQKILTIYKNYLKEKNKSKIININNKFEITKNGFLFLNKKFVCKNLFAYQKQNLIIAIFTLNFIFKDKIEFIFSKLKNINLMGRNISLNYKSNRIFFDVAHNDAGIYTYLSEIIKKNIIDYIYFPYWNTKKVESVYKIFKNLGLNNFVGIEFETNKKNNSEEKFIKENKIKIIKIENAFKKIEKTKNKNFLFIGNFWIVRRVMERYLNKNN